jgi:hypothetical protein
VEIEVTGSSIFQLVLSSYMSDTSRCADSSDARYLPQCLTRVEVGRSVPNRFKNSLVPLWRAAICR